MSLEDTGTEVSTETGVNKRAKDGSGRIVVVSASYEAIADHGWSAIWQIASDKYDRGDFTLNGQTSFVRVTSAEC